MDRTAVAAGLAKLGWRTNTEARLVQAIEDFQGCWSLGTRLARDGMAGPKTQAALSVSLSRKAAGLPDISPHFSASELRCRCDTRPEGVASSCRRIWAHYLLVAALELHRTKVGPFTPARVCRCTRENAAVGGVSNSQHLYGLAADVPVYKGSTVAALRGYGKLSGLGFYRYSSSGDLVRHIDLRHLRGSTSTPTSPALWPYAGTPPTPLTPQPVTAPTPAPTPTPAPAPEFPASWFLTESGKNSPGMRRAIQRMLRATVAPSLVVDGEWGPATIRAIQKWVKVTQDGKMGPATRKAVQRKVYVAATGVWAWDQDTKPDPTTLGLQKLYNRAVRNRRKPF